jgi:hypothetical protein
MTGHQRPFRRGTSLLRLFGDARQGYSAPKARQQALYLENAGSDTTEAAEPTPLGAIIDVYRLHCMPEARNEAA